MKMTFALVVVAGILMPPSASSAAFAMPEEIANISMGMSVAELLKVRPKIQREGVLGSKIRWEAPKLLLLETLPAGGDFANASYFIDGGRLVSVTLVGHPAANHERDGRRKAIKAYVGKWGKGYHKRILKDEIRAGEFLPMLTWDEDDAEIILTLPKDRKKGDSKMNPLGIQVRTLAESQKHPWEEVVMPAKDRANYFRNHDVDEN